MKQGSFSRDASGRLTYEISNVGARSYAEVCRKVIDEFRLTATSDFVLGLDAMFRDYTDGAVTIGLEWDIWSGFIVTAKQPDAESLVRRIAAFLSIV
jgi:hypothetical protein